MDTNPAAMDARIKAWETEISHYFFRGGKAQVNANQLPLICHDQLLEFDSSRDSLKRILIGGKGTGKSTALARKAVQLLDDEMLVIPAFHPYVVRLEQLTLDDDLASAYPDAQSHYCWVQIWKLVLCTIYIAEVDAVRIKDAKLGQYLKCTTGKAEDEFFDQAGERIARARQTRHECVSTVLQLVLERHYGTQQCQQWFNRYVRPNLPAPGNEPTVMLLDQIDEALSRYRDVANTRQGQTVWEAAQTAIIDAVADIGSLSGEAFQVFAAIRTEAFRHYQDYGARTQAQVASICVDLAYTPGSMQQIFLQNIKLTERTRLALPEEADLIKRFLGVHSYPHPYVRGVVESAIQWISRHTFGSPRELVMHGLQIYKSDKSMRGSRQYLAQVINETGSTILNDYISELVPLWNEKVEAVYSHLTHNVMSLEEVSAIEATLQTPLGFAPIEYLYRSGMIGIPVDVDEKTSRQSFVPLSRASVGLPLPEVNYYIVHPCLYPTILGRLRQDQRAEFYSHILVAGDGLPCSRTIERPRVYLLLDYTNRLVEFSILDDPSLLNPPRTSILERLRPELTVSPEASAGPVLLIAILMAMSTEQSNYPKVEEICHSVRTLVEEGFCKAIFGNGNTRQMAIDYFRDQLMFAPGSQSHVVTELRKIVGRIQAGYAVSVTSAMERVDSFSITGLKWMEIRVVRR